MHVQRISPLWIPLPPCYCRPHYTSMLDYSKTYWTYFILSPCHPQSISIADIVQCSYQSNIKKTRSFNNSLLKSSTELQLSPGDLKRPSSDLPGPHSLPSPYLYDIPVVSPAHSALVTLVTLLLLSQHGYSPTFRPIHLLSLPPPLPTWKAFLQNLLSSLKSLPKFHIISKNFSGHPI